MKIILQLICLCSLFLGKDVFSWNAIGHKLIAQIAYNHLNAETKQSVNKANHALDVAYPAQNFVNASAWLDAIRYQDIKWYDRIHYVNWPFSKDGTTLPAVETINAMWAIDNALATLNSDHAKSFDKGLALRILIHVVADIHQPLHTVTLVSKKFPHGDAGGNFYRIKGGKLGGNLHTYWDKGAGFLMMPKHSSQKIAKKAQQISDHWGCSSINQDLNIKHWLDDSHSIAIKSAYNLNLNSKPNVQYKKEVQKITEQQVAFAGCRLAALLNNSNFNRGKH